MNDNFKSRYDTEGFLKSLAAEYVRETGEEFLRECETDAEGFDEKMLDSKMRAALELEKSKSNRNLTRRAATRGLIVASLILVVYMVSSLFEFSEDNFILVQEISDIAEEESIDTGEIMPAGNALRNFEFLAHSLPEGWQIIYTDFDGGATILHLESNTGNSVVVIAGAPIYDDPESGEFRKVYINEQPAFMRTESTHSILFFDMDGLQFVLSTGGEYQELKTLAESWI
jgi:hypothetical protein